MAGIEIKTGSATDPQPENGRGILIAHISNDCGAWGKGFVLAVNKVSLAAKGAYQGLAKDHGNLIPRGLVQIVELKPDVFAANMIAQQGIKKSGNPCLVDYKALEQCLKILFKRAIQLNCDVHIPAGIGSGLAGGDRTVIHQMIRTQAAICQTLLDSIGVNVTLWEFTDASSDSFVAPPPHPVTTPQNVPDSILGTPTEDDL